MGIIKEAENTDTLRIPITPLGNDGELTYRFLHSHIGDFAYLGFVKDENIRKLRNWMKVMNISSDRLLCNMNIKNPDNPDWYMTVADYTWFLTYLGLKDYAKCKALIDTVIRYAMTDEYYMIERYMITDPYYVPWSPNVSANGRLILMLLAYNSRN